MIHIVIKDTDTNETFLDRECVAIVGEICMADESAIEIVYTRNANQLTLAYATAAAVNSIENVFKHDSDIADAIGHAFVTEDDEEGGDEE